MLEGVIMNVLCFMGDKINKNIKYFLPNTVLFSNEKERITVTMIKEALDYILGIIAIQNPLVESYKTAKAVFSAMKMILENKKPSRPSKTDMKTTVDVLEEITNLSAKSEWEKEQNARYAFLCKLMIDGFGEKVQS